MFDLEWERIPGYPNYLVSEAGHIWSCRTRRILKTRLNHGGYELVNIYNSRGMSTKSVHRLVAQMFLEYISFDLEVNHIDGNKLNNHYSNLELVSSRENHRHAFNTGLRSSRFSPQRVHCVETQKTYPSLAEAAEDTKTSAGNISAVLRGISTHTGGYHFRQEGTEVTYGIR